jgi:hypothetical protein
MALSARPVLGATARKLADAAAVDEISIARERWQTYRFAEVADVVDPDWLSHEAAVLWPVLRPVAETSVSAPRIIGSALSDGWRLKRVDPGRPDVPEAIKQPMLDVYERYGLHEWGAELSRQVAPIVSAILGNEVTYDRVYFLLYENDDYIGPHNDHQTGARVNVQFPVTSGGVAGLRVLDWDWHTYRDTPGLLRILGPLVWHEVLPLIGSAEAYRLNISLRYWLKS